MLTLRIYYLLKPGIPRRLRLALRRLYAKWVLRSSRSVWPIKPGNERKPDGWLGWPGGKRFALVLTHDVESQKGLDQTRELQQLEMSMGLRSAFYFIPEGTYRTPETLRAELRGNGFEVGVHDLMHDGKLYQSLKSFKAQADRINQYLKEWGACGFRSGFMHHNLDWLHHLEVLYDGSTFDTDPFEPQPDGVDTIFPFWVPAPQGGGTESPAAGSRPSGYVEMPYTLPQDFTLFVILRETSTEIWKRKLNWIAEHGGMAVLNTHPDYMAFGGAKPRQGEYSSRLYEEFLEWVQRTHGDSCWQALPRDVARLCAVSRPAQVAPPDAQSVA